MQVIRQDVDSLNATLKVEIAPEDYGQKVKSSLEKYRKTVKIPGFRPGHVPFGLVQKQYGKAVLADVLNDLIKDSLDGYVRDNNLNILGGPLPSESNEMNGDFNQPADFTFEFQIGFAPEVRVDLASITGIEYNKVQVDAELLEKQLIDLRRRYGKLLSAEEVGEEDFLTAQLVELENNEIKPGGFMKDVSFLASKTKEEVKSSLMKLVVGDKLTVKVNDLVATSKELEELMGLTSEVIAVLNDTFQLTLKDIKRMVPAELNQELYNRLFGEGEVSSEEELKQRVESDLTEMFNKESEKLFMFKVYEKLLEETSVQFPEHFLKRWILNTSEKELSEEQVETEYPSYEKSLKWELIKSNLFEIHGLSLTRDELVDYTKGMLASNYAQYGIPVVDDAELTQSALNFLAKKDQVRSISDMLTEQKLIHLFKNTIQYNEVFVTNEEFNQL
jgi:trigger factor